MVAVGYGWNYGHVGTTGMQVSTDDVGTPVLDFVEPKAKKPLWRGTARGAVDPSPTPEERTARVRDAVARIVDQYPPER